MKYIEIDFAEKGDQMQIETSSDVSVKDLQTAIEMLNKLVEAHKKLSQIWIDVDSSVIKRLRYHEMGAIEMEFSNGHKYLYTELSFAEFNEMINADSVGEYYNANIKGKYPVAKLD